MTVLASRRVVTVQIGAQSAELRGPAAEVVALVAATDPGELTLRLAAALLQQDARVRLVVMGSVELHVKGGALTILLRETLTQHKPHGAPQPEQWVA